jgi:hypothetical protein
MRWEKNGDEKFFEASEPSPLIKNVSIFLAPIRN